MHGHGHHEHAGAHPERGPVRRRVAADEREREQVTHQQHVHVQQRRRHAGEHVRPVHQPQPADVDDRGDARMRQHGDPPGAQQPGHGAGPAPGQRAERERHRRGPDEQQRGDHPDEQVPGDVQPQVVRAVEPEAADPGHRHRHPEPHQPGHGPSCRPRPGQTHR